MKPFVGLVLISCCNSRRRRGPARDAIELGVKGCLGMPSDSMPGGRWLECRRRSADQGKIEKAAGERKERYSSRYRIQRQRKLMVSEILKRTFWHAS
jgi:hypothetical protein